ncbi:hypothetical protein [Roseivirga sp. E12]|uniref:YybH family protein n=1 Tax=Roseivirga sp. E12 TaxID=2819237 RepID=UPI001ABCF276|nr:hypothetical protein [Roseivirga sp. E12]MBO3697266.1 hypothetical protein [Roseivirga sp. E12]
MIQIKYRLFACLLLCAMAFSTQAQTDTGKAFFKALKEEVLILTENGLLRNRKDTKQFVKAFMKQNTKSSYESSFSVAVNSSLAYEIGVIRSGGNVFSVMLIKQQGIASTQQVEFLVIYEKDSIQDVSAAIDKRRAKWMELCNAHQASTLVTELYTQEAYYYNRGRVLQGPAALSAEYSYMNDSNYSLKLTPRHVAFVSENIAYEIGKCSGSYPLPYMLLWEKQADGNWQIKMDSNY